MICGDRPKRRKRQRISIRDVDRLPRSLHYVQDSKQILLVSAKQKMMDIVDEETQSVKITCSVLFKSDGVF